MKKSKVLALICPIVCCYQIKRCINSPKSVKTLLRPRLGTTVLWTADNSMSPRLPVSWNIGRGLWKFVVLSNTRRNNRNFTALSVRRSIITKLPTTVVSAPLLKFIVCTCVRPSWTARVLSCERRWAQVIKSISSFTAAVAGIHNHQFNRHWIGFPLPGYDSSELASRRISQLRSPTRGSRPVAGHDRRVARAAAREVASVAINASVVKMPCLWRHRCEKRWWPTRQS